MKDALDEAELLPSDIDYINLHGTSTPMGDPPELMAVHRLFDECADKLHVSATKSMTGHLLGAAGAIEAAATVLAVKNDIIPPTINTQTIDPNIEMRVNPTLYTPVKKTVRAALSNTFGFGGQNASMVFKKHVQ
jgi:3-oxoacyl-[acyl-carrier-protein] synthase II